jgi:hypothetical protein
MAVPMSARPATAPTTMPPMAPPEMEELESSPGGAGSGAPEDEEDDDEDEAEELEDPEELGALVVAPEDSEELVENWARDTVRVAADAEALLLEEYTLLTMLEEIPAMGFSALAQQTFI